MEGTRQYTLRIVLLAVLALIIFWLVMRFWHMRHTTSPNAPRHASARVEGGLEWAIRRRTLYAAMYPDVSDDIALYGSPRKSLPLAMPSVDAGLNSDATLG
jgi:hypothetical protein